MEAERPGSMVSSLHCHDLTGDGELDLIVGRDDGSLEVFATSGIPELLNEGPTHRRYTYVRTWSGRDAGSAAGSSMHLANRENRNVTSQNCYSIPKLHLLASGRREPVQRVGTEAITCLKMKLRVSQHFCKVALRHRDLQGGIA